MAVLHVVLQILFALLGLVLLINYPRLFVFLFLLTYAVAFLHVFYSLFFLWLLCLALSKWR